ncbi:hypothetical protein OsJ_07987 [Oryza sativa Japonica Group]|uniref:Uncharacterized protein n=1 Tax=Oryza sativa subsp. japonica TaxID=39947 RepID=B9F1W4_ORYSJ|nr:hypothetical protein OsJ_07987 [Oryza sativa Japonica Group]
MGMRCKKHPYQAGGGVCATCLNDRLLALAAAQNGASSSPPPPAAPPAAAAPAFPRSVSPYVSRRKSDSSGGGALKHHPSLLFFRTPQVGPAYGSSGGLEEGDIGRSCRVVSNRGLSPERDCDGSDEESSSPTDPPWQPSPSPMRRTPCRRRQTSTMPSGFAVCLSPLVRPSPGRRHRHAHPPDPGTFSCELRPSPLHNLSSAASITRCRSRKLADGGRFR